MEVFEEFDFHDGSFDGLRIDRTSVSVFVRSRDGHSFVVALTEVAALTAGEIKAGNIIFDLQLRQGNEITAEDVRRLHEIGQGVGGEVEVLLRQVRESGGQVFEITSSYGGELLALAKGISIAPASPSKPN